MTVDSSKNFSTMTSVINWQDCDAQSFTLNSSESIGILVRTQNYDARKVTQIITNTIIKNENSLFSNQLFHQVNTTLHQDMTNLSSRGCKAITASVSNNVIVVVINCRLLRIILAHSYILLQRPIWVCDQWFIWMVSYKNPRSEICHKSMRIMLIFPQGFGHNLSALRVE